MQCIHLDQLAFQFYRAQQLLECRPFARFMRVVALLSQADTNGSGVDGHLSDDTVVAVHGLDP